MGLHSKLAEVMVAVGHVEKRGTAPAAMGGYKFVTAPDVADAVRGELGKRGVSMLPTAIEVIEQYEQPTRGGGEMHVLTLRITWHITDGESGESIDIVSVGTGADSGDKASPKAQTNSLKYALLMAFQIPQGDDPEAASLPPTGGRRNGRARPSSAEPGDEGVPPAPEPGSAPSSDDGSFCRVHGVQRRGHPGDYFHRAPDGRYCRPENEQSFA